MNPRSRPSAIEAAVARYLAFLQSEENKSPLTIDSYRQSLSLTTALLDIDEPMSLDKQVVRLLKQRLHEYRTNRGGELSVGTKNHHLTVLRSFLRYLLREENLPVYPPDHIRRLREPERRVKVLRSEEIDRLLSMPNAQSRIGKRDRAILELFYATGLRLEELRRLNRSDVNLKTCEIPVRGKRGRVRVVFLTEPAAQALRDYFNSRLDHLSPLFIRNPDRATFELPPGEAWRLSRVSIRRLVQRYALEAGIVTKPSPHTLRHSFATEMLRGGADLRSVQEQLGHRDLSTTQIYTHVTNPQLKEVHRRCHPRQKRLAS